MRQAVQSTVGGAPTARTRIAELATWAASLRLADVPETALERARLQVANELLAAEAASASAAVARLRAAVRGWGADGPCSVIGEEGGLDAASAAYANGAASIAHDWDDYLYMGHTGHSAVWASRAAGEAVGASVDEQLAAQIAANEIEGRLGAALLLGPHNGQFWATIHCAGAAVAAGRLLGLDAERLAHAVALALYQPPYGLFPGFMGPDSKLLTAAEPTAQGIRAAALAQQGLTGALDLIESPRGLLAHFAFVGQPEMLGGLGEVWLTDTLAFKPHPGCAYLQAPVNGLLAALGPDGISAAEVDSIEVGCGYLTMAMEQLSRGEPLTPVRVNFSVRLSLAVVLAAGRLTHEELAESWIARNESQLRALARRIELRHDWDLTLETVAAAGDSGHARALARMPLERWRTVRRRMRELGMDDLAIGPRELGALLTRPGVRRALAAGVRARLARTNHQPRLSAVDVSRLRLRFPAQLRIRLRSGRTIEVAALEPGGCGAAIDEQRDVVRAKATLLGSALEAL